MTPMQAIRKHCLWCCCNQAVEVRLCPAEKCPLNAYRHGTLKGIESPSPLRAIRARCLDCVGMSSVEVERCESDCTLHAFRFGKNPNFSQETRDKCRERMLNRGPLRTKAEPQANFQIEIPG